MRGEVKEAFRHTLSEIELSNIWLSLYEGDFEIIQKAHDSIHELIYIAPLCIPKNKSFHEKSAFLAVYLFNVFYAAHRSFIEALSGFYNCAYTLLRNCLESAVRGAYYECLAHRKFRDNPNIPEITRKGRKTLKGWINGLIREGINKGIDIEGDLETLSASIFDKLEVIEDEGFKREFLYHPNYLEMIEALKVWGMLDPLPDPRKFWQDLYDELSKEAHAYPDRTEVGKRLLQLSSGNIFEVNVIPTELNKFCQTLHKIIDFSMLIELNILEEWIKENNDVKEKLKERLMVVQNLGLQLSYEKLRCLLTYY